MLVVSLAADSMSWSRVSQWDEIQGLSATSLTSRSICSPVSKSALGCRRTTCTVAFVGCSARRSALPGTPRASSRSPRESASSRAPRTASLAETVAELSRVCRMRDASLSCEADARCVAVRHVSSPSARGFGSALGSRAPTHFRRLSECPFLAWLPAVDGRKPGPP